jgi:hypothetical protein
MGGANTQQFKSDPNSLRPDGTMKGSGFLGGMKRLDDPTGVSSEISIGVDWGSGEKLIPTMVPTLDSNEINYLLSTPEDKIFEINPDLGKSIQKKAVEHAIKREQQGLPYFAQENESPKPKQNNTMGGANTQTPQSTQDSYNPAVSAKEEKTYARLDKQGMSGSGDESLASYIAVGKDIYGDLRSKAASLISPNSFGRDAKKVDPASVIKKEKFLPMRKDSVEEVIQPMSSYDAIDAGLR